MKNIFTLICFFSFSSALFAQNKQGVSLDLETKKNIIETVSSTLLKNYVYPDKAKLMARHIKEQAAKGNYNSITDPNELSAKIVKDLRFIHNDSHLRIEYDPQLEKDIIAFLSSKNTAKNISAADMANDAKKNFHFKKVEILPSNIGYIQFDGFAVPGTETAKVIYAAMQFVAHTDALIIDLRNNFGGNGTTAVEVASYFFRNKTFTGKTFDRIENKWTDQFIENKKSMTTGLVLDMPVYILVSNRTFSAAEGLSYTLQHIKHAVIIGDTTRGGAHLTRSFSLGNGFVGFIPYQRSENAITKTDWEGIGVLPDSISDENRSLFIAQNIILHKKLVAATNEMEKKKILYIINYNSSKNVDVKIDPSTAAKYTGRFAEFEVIIKDNELLFRDTNQRTISYKKMNAITPNFFQVANDYQVEFILENSICTSIKMYWDDGYEDKIPKSNK